MPTPIFCCGAECGIVTAGASGGVLHWNAATTNVSADTTTFRSPGARSYKFSPAGAVSKLTKTLASPTVGVFRAYVLFPTLPNANTNLAAFTTSGSFAFFNYNQATNKFRVAVTGNGATGADVGPTLNANQWYRIDFRADVSANPWKLDVKIDGSTETQFTNGLAATVFTGLQIGGLIDTSIGTPTLTVYWDDIIVSTTGADWPFGAGAIVGLSPTADGTHNFNASTDFQYNGGTGVAVGATDTWSHVSTVPLTQITTYMAVTGASNTEYLEWQFAHSPSDVSTINGVEVVASNLQSGTSAAKQTLRLNDGGTTSDVYTDLSAAHTSIGYSTKHYATKPTGGSWTKTAIDAIRARWNSSYGTVDESPVPRIAGVMLEMDYIQSAGGVTGTAAMVLKAAAAAVALTLVPGSGAVTLKPSLAAAATEIVVGSAAVVEKPSLVASGSASGAVTTGIGAIQLKPKFTDTATVILTGSGAVVIKPSLAGVGKEVALGSAAVTVKPTIAGTGHGASVAGTGSPKLKAVFTDTATVFLKATGAVQLTPKVAGVGGIPSTGTAGVTVRPTLAGVGHVTAPVVQPVTIQIGGGGSRGGGIPKSWTEQRREQEQRVAEHAEAPPTLQSRIGKPRQALPVPELRKPRVHPHATAGYDALAQQVAELHGATAQGEQAQQAALEMLTRRPDLAQALLQPSTAAGLVDLHLAEKQGLASGSPLQQALQAQALTKRRAVATSRVARVPRTLTGD